MMVLLAMAFLQFLSQPAGAQPQQTLGSLIPAADAIVVALVSSTDFSRTSSDGPMIAQARVLSTVKGRLRKDQSFEFTETAWVGPRYQSGEVRILFLESAGANRWRVLSNLFAKVDFFIARDAIPLLNMNSLRSALEKLSLPASRSILITADMLK
jgi:hypothetical protein